MNPAAFQLAKLHQQAILQQAQRQSLLRQTVSRRKRWPGWFSHAPRLPYLRANST